MSYTIIRDVNGHPTGLNVNWSSISGEKVSLREAELLTRLGEEATRDVEAIFREMASALETSRELLDFAVSVAKTGNEQASEALDQRDAAYKERDNCSRGLDTWRELAVIWSTAAYVLHALLPWSKAAKDVLEKAQQKAAALPRGG
jgi:hypothetical protein